MQQFAAILGIDDRDVNKAISPNDEMLQGDVESHYFAVGWSALSCIDLSMRAANKDKGDIKKILDLPCGHGRVLRMLRAAFPVAEITACDLVRDGVDYCSKTFNAIPIYSSRQPEQISLEDKRFDLIWCGSLLTHLNAEKCILFLRLFDSLLTLGGILVFSIHGPSCVYAIKQGCVNYSLDEKGLTDLCNDYDRVGFGYQDYRDKKNYGTSVASPAWVTSQLEKLTDLRLLMYTEMGWDNHHDVISCVKEPMIDRLARALKTTVLTNTSI
jgi:SAM-dependent methyltransferase